MREPEPRKSWFKKNGDFKPNVIRRYAKKSTKLNAIKARQSMTPCEAAIWKRLHSLSLRFRRQSVILGWIADFYHPRSKVVIEIDGGYHSTPEQQSKDAYRDSVMLRRGLRVIRFTNKRVETEFEQVISEILAVTQGGCKGAPSDRRDTQSGSGVEASITSVRGALADCSIDARCEIVRARA